jgi:hypothetical protein
VVVHSKGPLLRESAHCLAQKRSISASSVTGCCCVECLQDEADDPWYNPEDDEAEDCDSELESCVGEEDASVMRDGGAVGGVGGAGAAFLRSMLSSTEFWSCVVAVCLLVILCHRLRRVAPVDEWQELLRAPDSSSV